LRCEEFRGGSNFMHTCMEISHTAATLFFNQSKKSETEPELRQERKPE
jgi:hypothetical protein